ncbi:BREX-1 system adenine-specific DNA-methyltransferase PglX [Litorilituus sediminis]|uniref:site-specific DNA-methyltransferase (adenine-specific) n=1 Tax=Litorilituus sediminis TaxID=718192 RepID=A0A4P6P828_9GAMM|nr:BREX-1 system adenine-specific DNA-methyltransferase PglX [Litorilituus sediminis]QBG37248.1 BREX-1 system adenine-specific DNA-methyltransferase PglX [Litorilituus sediminis]
MDTSKLKKFAQYARRSLIEQVQSKLKLVLAEDSAARREHPQAVKALEAKQKEFGDDQQLIEQVAYTWFNRFCALRFMDANQYNRIMVVSPIAGQFQPEILAEAKAGHLDDSVFDAKTSDKIRGLLSGAIPSRDGQAEAYRLIIVGVCNDYHRLMPYLFERIQDYTELLMPEDLLSGNSILAYTREAMTPENCESVESIGWLYQFYISEKKDQVFEGLKKNKKITPENIPAATQLFTPHWIVKYLVENSLGRLWMLNNPSSKLIEQMEYYIKPVEEEQDFLKISSPEELKICDPAAGSGHMLTYAYDLLYAIYLDANYDPVDIPELILTKNLYGIEIDERAAELAAFALSMKAMKGNPFDDSNNRRRFFRNPIKPNICRLEKVKINETDLEEYIEFAGKDLFTADVRATLKEFEEADNFGSLIQPTLKEPAALLEKLESKDAQIDLFLKGTHESILKILEQVKYLSPIYHAVIANPPYLGNKGMNPRMNKWLGDNYSVGKSDMYAAFIIRSLNLTKRNCYAALVTMQSWMFTQRYSKFRQELFLSSHIECLAHLGNMVMGIAFGTSASVFKHSYNEHKLGQYSFVGMNNMDGDKPKEFCRKSTASIFDIKSLPESPIVYWADDKVRSLFLQKSISDYFETREGLATADNDRFLREWHEISFNNIGLGISDEEDAIKSRKRWFPYVKGGSYRKWAGNSDLVVDWFDDGFDVKNNIDERTGRVRSHNYNGKYAFRKGFTWSGLTNGGFSVRHVDGGYKFDAKGPMGFTLGNHDLFYVEAFLNSSVASYLLGMLSPTADFKLGQILSLPLLEDSRFTPKIIELSREAISISQEDWDSYETSRDFKWNPILKCGFNSLRSSYEETKKHANEKYERLLKIEFEINQMFIELYDLGRMISPDVDPENVSIYANPEFTFNVKADDLDSLHREKSIFEFISYAVGCMFGRYSIDKEGLILGTQNETLEDYLTKVPSSSFIPDADNVIPIIDFEGDWFEDDISERFKEFLKVTFGEENFAENLAFIEDAIGKDIRKYFVKDFYADHVKRYKKRPIYWMFSSPKGSFNALIYMHRYQPDTVSIVLNDYLREFRTKLEARKESYEQVEISASASQKDKTNAIKAISKINKVLEEINDYEHDVLYPLAGEKIEIDLDDGVKHNYPLFGKALKKITGLS